MLLNERAPSQFGVGMIIAGSLATCVLPNSSAASGVNNALGRMRDAGNQQLRLNTSADTASQMPASGAAIMLKEPDLDPQVDVRDASSPLLILKKAIAAALGVLVVTSVVLAAFGAYDATTIKVLIATVTAVGVSLHAAAASSRS